MGELWDNWRRDGGKLGKGGERESISGIYNQIPVTDQAQLTKSKEK